MDAQTEPYWLLSVLTISLFGLDHILHANSDKYIIYNKQLNRGSDLCQVVRNDPHWSTLAVLFLFTHTDTELVQKVFAASADDYILFLLCG